MNGTGNDFIVIKALENGVNVIGLTRGESTRFHHSEKLDKGEIMIAQFTEHTSAIKVRGKAIIQTSNGTIDTLVDE
ncbi:MULTISPECIES: trp RNA-binding attenuation protein MtrB [Aneurinibacillus]|uniref:Transcription attenuation protein MtrB n=1 Tax=Aneurinibacillus thermoaerophilus TaxID=143495 RepID=A0A1G8BQT8_ANETH|nr:MULTISPECIES: trp RNA-binding attenuation protein MtrB [Aneurinibacillus]AMA73580.1 transcription attenuation protein MtrB [Aneurinibacillus sp. XH2]MED0674971.1 trp RNA-binding attenuation protein MtrB [Aneurinibacillus thermoaerophilus]MED0737374.1 trp RNA-binding attenuation protein MtrB [Aneurinibacillus thermoaerophilus]MED0756223.1 trp RNA-binding attenuation protein MtrB [Aneurinibacillus thermoaerophilus]MED0760342.1 trp RNA-binding attenuation protein MtrB [Aneurinibacillus thermoa